MYFWEHRGLETSVFYGLSRDYFDIGSLGFALSPDGGRIREIGLLKNNSFSSVFFWVFSGGCPLCRGLQSAVQQLGYFSCGDGFSQRAGNRPREAVQRISSVLIFYVAVESSKCCVGLELWRPS